ncbi:phosphoadenosine phosphosulfate reductase family protein [Candidatus Thiothrix sp. Deng01]|uniref:Phosphoadenosine phosphosulfate reductase family protein n=1 Tax=Candidatus Thiothrix phosphatis TaxID=3112415 RepID=A0ABU6D5H3_9GAMM|nr:phosphoadenosine phosphosulfate reductase family protein [Candidatus Thiothrix sp. Deng01]MEB4593557.1 phosphoadenosine phosphosulfate reductase family protein [Candidatus Thiothrix sp. Deng01]
MNDLTEKKPVRHLLGLSGGKDSSALAIYIRDKYPEIHEKMEYFFSDTGAELPETLEYIDKLEDYLCKPIVRLLPDGFKENQIKKENSNEEDGLFGHYLKLHKNYLPSPQQRWCTINLKLIPFERFVGNDEAISYIGIRADEPDRVGYISSKPNIKTRMPFREDGLDKEDIFKILESSGIGIPEYYKWRSRSGCYFCFFQRKEEWIGLKKNHPDLFERAKKYEQLDEDTDIRYTWSSVGTLEELISRPDSVSSKKIIKKSKRLMDIVEDTDDDADGGCLICTL